MKIKIVGWLVFMLTISSLAYSLELSYTIPDAKVDEYISDYCYIHKNTETMPDPNWVDPTPDEPYDNEAPQILKYTDQGWTKEHIRRYIGSQIRRGKNAKYRDNYKATDDSDVE